MEPEIILARIAEEMTEGKLLIIGEYDKKWKPRFKIKFVNGNEVILTDLTNGDMFSLVCKKKNTDHGNKSAQAPG